MKRIDKTDQEQKESLSEKKSTKLKFIFYTLTTLACGGLSMFLLSYILGASYCLSLNIDMIIGMYVTHNLSYWQNAGNKERAIIDIVTTDFTLMVIMVIMIFATLGSSLNALPVLPQFLMKAMDWPILLVFILLAARFVVGLSKAYR